MRLALAAKSGVLWLAFFAALARSEQVTVVFPERSVGLVTISSLSDAERTVSRSAAGTLSIDASNARVKLTISAAATTNLTFLKTLPADLFTELELAGGTLDSDALECFLCLESLEKLDLTRCKFVPGAFNDLPALSNLRELRTALDRRGNFLQWIGSNKTLETLFCYPSLRSGDFEAIGSLPGLRSTTIDLAADAQASIDQLSKYPTLTYLGLECVIDQEALSSLNFDSWRSLQNLEELRWFYGSVVQNAVDVLVQLKSLKRLHFVQVIPSQGLWDGIAQIEDLESLYYSNPDNFDAIGSEIVPLLASLPDLHEWPRLRNVDRSSIELIADCPWVTSLELQGLSPGTTSSDLCYALERLRNLRRLDLENMPFADEDLRSLEGTSTLESLKLFATDASGSGFQFVQGLPNLARVHWSGGSNSEGPVDLDITALPLFPALKEVEIGGDTFMPADLYPLARCKQLRRIRLFGGGLADDSVATAIASLPALEELFLSDNCVVTDKGAMALSKCETLSVLAVNGFFSSDGFVALAKLPGLRRLSARSTEISSDEFQRLRDSHSSVPYMYGGTSPRVSVVFSDDGFLREKSSREPFVERGSRSASRTVREKMDDLENQPIIDLCGEETSFTRHVESLNGKVVLIDFWGTWCGPCRRHMSKLKRLRAEYKDQGFEILGVHTQQSADQLPEFIAEKDIQWPNVVDAAGSLVEAFEVPHFPSYFLVDRHGMLRVALVHPLGLEAAVEQLVSSKQ